MKKKSLIVFDIDGTLTDSVKAHQRAFTETLFEIGVSEINSEYKSFKHHTDSFIAKEIYENNQKTIFSTDKIHQFENRLFEKIKRLNFNEVKGAKEIVNKIHKETEYGVCYATGSLRKPAEHKLKSIGIEFEEWQLVASDKIFEREKIVQQAIKNSSDNYKVQSFKRVISVGDGLWDLLTADNLNLEFIGIGEENKDLLIKNGAMKVFRDLTEFKIE